MAPHGSFSSHISSIYRVCLTNTGGVDSLIHIRSIVNHETVPLIPGEAALAIIDHDAGKRNYAAHMSQNI